MAGAKGVYELEARFLGCPHGGIMLLRARLLTST